MGSSPAFLWTSFTRPSWTEILLQLATLYVQLGLADDALSVLESEPTLTADSGEPDGLDLPPLGSEVEPREQEDQLPSSSAPQPLEDIPTSSTRLRDIRVLLHKYKLLLSKGRIKEYVNTGCELLAFFLRELYNRPEVKVMMRLKAKKRAIMRTQPESNKVPLDVRREEKELEGLLSVQEWLQVFMETCTGLWRLGPTYYQRILHFIYCATTLNKFTGELEKSFLFYAASLCYIVRDYGSTFMLLRELAFSDPGCKHIWTIMNLLPLDIKIQKFLLRLTLKNPSNPYLLLVLSNYSLSNSHYKFALSQYELAYKETGSSDYLLSLCIAIVFINMASQIKHSPNKNACVTQATGFLYKYLKLRGHCQETMFNLGRAYHQLGIVHTACHFYKKVLSLEPECRLPQWSSVSDLRGEAAFNLSLIYRASGNHVLALNTLRKYCRI